MYRIRQYIYQPLLYTLGLHPNDTTHHAMPRACGHGRPHDITHWLPVVECLCLHRSTSNILQQAHQLSYRLCRFAQCRFTIRQSFHNYSLRLKGIPSIANIRCIDADLVAIATRESAAWYPWYLTAVYHVTLCHLVVVLSWWDVCCYAQHMKQKSSEPFGDCSITDVGPIQLETQLYFEMTKRLFVFLLTWSIIKPTYNMLCDRNHFHDN